MKRLSYYVVSLTVLCASTAHAESAKDILKAGGVKGGLVVVIGCDDPALIVGLRANDSYLMHGLDTDAKNVAKARVYIQSKGLYGPVSADTFDGKRLPYANNLVNLVVAESLGGLPMKEVMRVLAPLGVAQIGGKKTVKPWPPEIDEWTHFLHGPDGNAVSRDTRVDKPRSLRWAAAPKYSRHHDEVLTTSAMVTGKGRIFSIVDEAPRSTFHKNIGGKYSLIARDAFNGLELWRKPIADWGWRSWGARQNVRFSQPIQLPKRMVVDGDRLYVTLGWNAPVSVIDAQSGETIKTLEHSKYADELLISDGKLVVSVYEQVVRPAQQQKKSKPVETKTIKKRIRAIDPGSGRMLWETDWLDGLTARYDAVAPQAHLELTVKNGKVFAITREKIVCFSLTDGKALWNRARPEHPAHKMMLGVSMHNNCTVLADEKRLYVAQPVGKLRNTFHTIPCDLYAYDALTGKQLWKLERKIGSFAWGIHADVFLIDGMLWSHEHHERPMKGASPVDQNPIPYALVGIDAETGRIKQRYDTRPIFNIAHHGRCYRGKATERFVLTARRGTELIDLKTGQTDINHWLRGECRFGIMPANGLLYVPPDPCACHVRIKVDGFLGMSADAPPGPDASPRLVKGSAYDAIKPFDADQADWPMHRGNPRRGGDTAGAIGADLTRAWAFDAGEPITQATCVKQQVFLACKDSHQVKALSIADGRLIWSFTASGRIDSPPTFSKGRLLFGSADGWVYCLRATDGALAWKFRAAPARRLIVVRGQLESAWPVHGSVMVLGDTAYVAAGRSSYVDGGIHAWALNVKTGRVVKERTVKSSHESTKRKPQEQTFDADGALNHLLASDGNIVYLQNAPLFDTLETPSPPRPFLVATCGMLDGSMFSRTGWTFVGASWMTGSQIVHDNKMCYITRATTGFRRNNVFVVESGYGLMGAALPDKPESYKRFDSNAYGSLGYRHSKMSPVWSRKVSVRGQALLLAANALLVSGFPDKAPADDTYAAFEGRLGGKLFVIDRKTGKTLSALDMEAPPVWDGLSMASGRIFAAQTNGKLLCLKTE